MDTEVKFGSLPEQFRHVIELAERASRNAYANAINHTELEPMAIGIKVKTKSCAIC